MLFSSQQLPGAVIGRLSPLMQGSAKGTSAPRRDDARRRRTRVAPLVEIKDVARRLPFLKLGVGGAEALRIRGLAGRLAPPLHGRRAATADGHFSAMLGWLTASRRPAGRVWESGLHALSRDPSSSESLTRASRVKEWASSRRGASHGDVLMNRRRRLCRNQNFTARSCRIGASTSTPSMRRLLDGVAMPVPHRSTEPGRRSVIAEHPTHWFISTQAAASSKAIPTRRRRSARCAARRAGSAVHIQRCRACTGGSGACAGGTTRSGSRT